MAGSHAVQAALEHGTPAQAERIVAEMAPRVAEWAFHKFGSYVCRSALQAGTPQQREHIVDAVVLPHFDELIRDMSGSHVVQTAFRFSGPAHQDAIVTNILSDVVEFSRNPYANYLYKDVRSIGTAMQKEALITATLQNADRLMQHESGQFQVRTAFTMMDYWNPRRAHQNVIGNLIHGWMGAVEGVFDILVKASDESRPPGAAERGPSTFLAVPPPAET